MSLHYKSTRNSELKVTASEAISKGLAPDGGLFVPEEIPKLDVSMEQLKSMSYQEIAYEVMKLFLADFTEGELKGCIEKAYDSKFDTEEIASLVKVSDTYYLELFHGATIAFKDMALSILPHLLTTSAKKNHVENKIVILTATSGDTGKAAMAGFADVEGTQIIVFYPKNGVSQSTGTSDGNAEGKQCRCCWQSTAILTMRRAVSKQCLKTKNLQKNLPARDISFHQPTLLISDAWFRRLFIMYMHMQNFWKR